MRFRPLLLFVTCLIMVAPACAQDLPTRAEVLSTLRLVDEHWIDEHPDPGSRGWARSVYMAGHTALYEISPRQSDLDYAVLWGENNVWSMHGGPTTRNADHQCCGQTYAQLYGYDPVPLRIADITTSIEGMIDSSESDDWWWCDSLFMAMPVFTRLGLIHDDTRCFDKMYDLYHDTRSVRGLFDESHGLWYRDLNYVPPYTTPGGQPCFWSRGNGWVFAGLARTLEDLPADDPHRDVYVVDFQAMAAALIEVQRPDGFWNVSLADTTDFPGPETSGTAFFTCGMAWGIRRGLLDEATYLPVIARAWQGMVDVAVHPDGVLGYVQGYAGDPSASQPVTYDDTSDYGVGSFLLAGSELFLLAQGASQAAGPPEAQPFLTPNRPNPFNPATVLRFHLPRDAGVHVAVYDLVGRRVSILADGHYAAGWHDLAWRGRYDDGHPASSGVYICRLGADGANISRRMTLAR